MSRAQKNCICKRVHLPTSQGRESKQTIVKAKWNRRCFSITKDPPETTRRCFPKIVVSNILVLMIHTSNSLKRNNLWEAVLARWTKILIAILNKNKWSQVVQSSNWCSKIILASWIPKQTKKSLRLIAVWASGIKRIRSKLTATQLAMSTTTTMPAEKDFQCLNNQLEALGIGILMPTARAEANKTTQLKGPRVLGPLNDQVHALAAASNSSLRSESQQTGIQRKC